MANRTGTITQAIGKPTQALVGSPVHRGTIVQSIDGFSQLGTLVDQPPNKVVVVYKTTVPGGVRIAVMGDTNTTLAWLMVNDTILLQSRLTTSQSDLQAIAQNLVTALQS